MQHKNRWMKKYPVKKLAILPITAACLLFGTVCISSNQTPKMIHAENKNTYVMPSMSITGTVSFESSTEPTKTEMEYDIDESFISAATSVSSDFNEIEKPKPVQMIMKSPVLSTTNLNAFHGVCDGPSGKETYYNLPMDGVIKIMRKNGYDEQSYPYWVREDGVKMFGDYIMVAADLSTRPKGTIIECSLGTAMVVDTGTFVYTNPTQLDIAVIW